MTACDGQTHPLGSDEPAVAAREFKSQENAGIVRRSNPPWSSPMHMVPKPMPYAYGALVVITPYVRPDVKDSYPLPNIIYCT